MLPSPGISFSLPETEVCVLSVCMVSWLIANVRLISVMMKTLKQEAKLHPLTKKSELEGEQDYY